LSAAMGILGVVAVLYLARISHRVDCKRLLRWT
jgi:hypothetical protein